MAEDDGVLSAGQMEDDIDALLSEPQAEAETATTRTDLFGESESDEEDAAPAVPEDETAEPQTALPAESTAQPEQGDLPADDPQARPLDEDLFAEEAEQAEEDRPGPSAEPEEPPQPGEGPSRHDDIFASDSEDEQGQQGHISEAEETDQEDEFEAMFKTGKKRKRDKGRAQEIVLTAETLIANMEVAAEMDISANEEGKPAVNKIKMLPAVEEKLSQTMLHRELLDGGILGALKLWIELLPDGSLPNVKVRTAVFKILQRLPIDLTLEGRKEQLKKSELGRYVMFYAKLPDETLPNRQLARSLVETWSRPIFEQYREQRQDEEIQEREAELARLRKARKRSAEQAAPSPGAQKKLRPGDPGFRWHASIPAPAKLDYMKRPESLVPAGEQEAGRGKGKPKDKMSKKLVAMARAGGRNRPEQSNKVSLQGKGLLM